MEGLTDVEIEIDRPELVERTVFYQEGDEENRFTADTVHFRASLAAAETNFVDDPGVADDLDHKYFNEGNDIVLEWFDGVPEDAHPNHEDHIQLFLD